MRTAKKEMASASTRVTRSRGLSVDESQGAKDGSGVARVTRSKNRNQTRDKSDDFVSEELSGKLKSVLQGVDGLNDKAVAQNSNRFLGDAEDLLGMANSLVTCAKVHNEGVTPSDFVSCLLRKFGRGGGPGSSQNASRSSVRWEDIGQTVSGVFRSAPGFRTMNGPMDTELKQRKIAVHRKRSKPAENANPEELENTDGKTETDKNMTTMFNILIKNRKAKIENLILNRKSFAQTVENLFALSFLVKDGRAEITVDGGRHLVSPRNAPTALAIQSGESTYNHFMFRYDFKDWQEMLDSVVEGEELMPHRLEVDEETNTEPDVHFGGSRASQPSTPIRKLSRNRGLVMQEQTVVENSPESDNSPSGRAAARRSRRKLHC